MLAGLCLSSARAGPVFFVVSETPSDVVHGDAYVVPLTEDADIAHARDLIARGPVAAGAPIVVARIAAGADGINRNISAPGQPNWSWHVTQFEQFADITIEVLDGWPGFIEADVPGWIQNTNGAVGLWTYTITSELPGPPPVVIPLPAPTPAGLILATLWGIATGTRFAARGQAKVRRVAVSVCPCRVRPYD
ncbi:MAG: hypothetical protein ABIP55_00575 [Tepidisphaeraceae bacterium]